MARPSFFGNRKYFPLALATATAAALLAGSPVASAASDRSEPPASAAFTVAGTNGFSIDVESAGGQVVVVASEHRPPIATFSRGGRPRRADTANGAASIYYAPESSADPTEIDARLGKLGRIALAFHPSGLVRVTELQGSSAGCVPGARLVRRLGTFSGTVEFAGEDGYTSVQATRVKGSVGTPMPRGCAAERGAAARTAAVRRPWPAPGSAILNAIDRRAGTHFEARITDTGAAFRAVFEERQRGGLIVSRRAYAGAPPSAFAFDDALTSARVRPPAPFSGAARYAAPAGRGQGSWSGNLAATFPGVSIPMTGAGFRATLGGRR